jgi:hypothetical protein
VRDKIGGFSEGYFVGIGPGGHPNDGHAAGLADRPSAITARPESTTASPGAATLGARAVGSKTSEPVPPHRAELGRHSWGHPTTMAVTETAFREEQPHGWSRHAQGPMVAPRG